MRQHLDKFVRIITKLLGKNIALAEGRKFLEFPNLRFLGIRGSTASRAQDLVDKYMIKPRDALHACALENNIRNIVSDDSDFDVIKSSNAIGNEGQADDAGNLQSRCKLIIGIATES
jgi:predicted nucleic acid-binding protein